MGRIRTRSTGVFGLAGGIDVRTESLGRVLRTSHIGETRIIGNGMLVGKVVGSNGRPTVTAPGRRSAVQQVLYGKVDVPSRCVSRNLDAVGKSRHAAVRPTGSTILIVSKSRTQFEERIW